MSEFKALRSEELPAGEGAGTQIRRVRIGDGHVMVARLSDGRLGAFAPSCPHQVTPLDDATIQEGVMRCPRHGYQYDAATGVNVFPTRDAKPENLWKLKPKYLPVYEAVERDGWIWVSQEASPRRSRGTPPWRSAPRARPTSRWPLRRSRWHRRRIEQSMKFLTATAGEELEIRVGRPRCPATSGGWNWWATCSRSSRTSSRGATCPASGCVWSPRDRVRPPSPAPTRR